MDALVSVLAVLIRQALLVVAEPLQRVQQRQAQPVVLGHVRHVIGEDIEDIVYHQRVGGIADRALGEAHIQQPVQIRAVPLRTPHRSGAVVGFNWEVVVLGEAPDPEAPHTHFVAPVRSHGVHVLLQLIRDFSFPLAQGPDHLGDVVHVDQVVLCLLDIFTLAVLEVRHPDAGARDMAPGLLAFPQAVQAHDLRVRHSDSLRFVEAFGHVALPSQLEGLHFILDLLCLLGRVCLVGKVDHLLGVEGELVPAVLNPLEHPRSRVSHLPEEIVRCRVLEPQETVQLFLSSAPVLVLAQFVQMLDGRLCLLADLCISGVAQDLVGVSDGGGYRRQDLVQPVELFQTHHVWIPYPALFLLALDGVSDALQMLVQILLDIRRQIQIHPVPCVVLTVHIVGLPCDNPGYILHGFQIAFLLVLLHSSGQIQTQQQLADGFLHRLRNRVLSYVLIQILQQALGRLVDVLPDFLCFLSPMQVLPLILQCGPHLMPLHLLQVLLLLP